MDSGKTWKAPRKTWKDPRKMQMDLRKWYVNSALIISTYQKNVLRLGFLKAIIS